MAAKPKPFWDFDPDIDPLTGASLRTRQTGESGLLPTLPGQLPESINRGIRNVAGGVLGGMLSLPKRVMGSAQEYTDTGQYNPEPIMEAATTAMTGGLPFATPGMTLTSGLRRPGKPPPVVGTLHGTGSPSEYREFKLPPPEHDLGIHTTVNPNVGGGYAYSKASDDTIDFMSGMAFNDPTAARARIKPVLTDVQAALKFPDDAIKWNDPERVIETLERHMRHGFTAPRGLLSDMYNISGTQKGWQNDFVPMLKSRGYDALWYPHFDPAVNKSTYNTFMAFDPKQVVHRYTPEGQALIKERGVKDPITKVSDFNPEMGEFGTVPSWRLPPGILKNPEQIESFVRSPLKNTAKWWDNPKSPLYKIDAANKAEEAATKKKYEEHLKIQNAPYNKQPYDHTVSMLEGEKNKATYQYNKKNMTEEEYIAKISDIDAKMDAHYGSMLQKPTGVLSQDSKPKIKLTDEWINDIADKNKTEKDKLAVVNTYLQMKEGGKISHDDYVKLYKKVFGYKDKPVDNSNNPVALKAWAEVKEKKKAGLLNKKEVQAEYDKLFNQ